MNLVTGATGIIGSHLVLDLLKQGRRVRACRRSGSSLHNTRRLFTRQGAKALFEKIEWVEADVTDVFSLEDAMQGVDTVYHCAGLVSFAPRDRQKLMAINDTGTGNVVTACLARGVKALCHVSSIATIHNADHDLDLNEGVFWKNSGNESDYAISKYNGERQVWRGIEEGLNAVIVNPGVVLAAGFPNQSSSRLADAAYNGTRFYTPGMTAYVGAEDVARTMVLLMDGNHHGNRYIVVEGNYGFQHIFSALHRGMGRPAPKLQARPWMLRLAMPFERLACFFSGHEPRITSALLHSAFRQQSFSNAKIVSTLNYRFRKIDEVIDELCKWYLGEKQGL